MNKLLFLFYNRDGSPLIKQSSINFLEKLGMGLNGNVNFVKLTEKTNIKSVVLAYVGKLIGFFNIFVHLIDLVFSESIALS